MNNKVIDKSDTLSYSFKIIKYAYPIKKALAIKLRPLSIYQFTLVPLFVAIALHIAVLRSK